MALTTNQLISLHIHDSTLSMEMQCHRRRSYTDVTVRPNWVQLGKGRITISTVVKDTRKKTRNKEMQFNKGNDVMAE